MDGKLLDRPDVQSALMELTDTFPHTGGNGSILGDLMAPARHARQNWSESEASATDGYHAASETPYSASANTAEMAVTAAAVSTPGRTINGTSGNDRLNGTEGDDTLYGFGGSDVLDGKGGANAMYGGPGEDVYYVDHPGDRAYEKAGEGHDLVYSSVTYSLAGEMIEDLTLTGTDSINGIGNSLHNRLTGNSASNILDGGALNDIINGKGGKDVLIGGPGNDKFVFETAEEARGDTIVDFEHGVDKVVFLPMDANTLVEGDQAFKFIGRERFHNVAGELHTYRPGDGNTYISGDTNGDGVADFAIKVLGDHTFADTDFLL
ncbi:M10 family metallopeptidase C-terminal domain-containing protein [Microvirga puerhi]|uniref:M10 family metallopeptidase C-terminal domain-containing protein n=1 Tax=Microvirga puerhi TaxID=2876078 RepID=A0ABS7VSX4_9HYPH|nr:M10 family metallopeptidase C-terminal domain-containing protein [Microvirga puerhi]MBZ6078008.1 M10 family metallopeptidase C-terminal domain-containing protein [Microvirga puerhi]